jgi:alpha-tubulin suppressor-like RCC1 family protein
MAVHSPVKVPALTDVYQIAAGAWHSLALRGDGSVWAWGANDAGQLGIGHTDPATVSYPTPLQVPGLTGITFIAANGDYSFAVDSVGAVWAWGKNLLGTLGDGTTIDRSSPVHLSSLPLPAQAVDVGGAFSMALLNDGTVWTWGSNTWGQLGDSSTNNRSLPGRAGVTHIKRIAAGAHSPSLSGRIIQSRAGVRTTSVRSAMEATSTFGPFR